MHASHIRGYRRGGNPRGGAPRACVCVIISAYLLQSQGTMKEKLELRKMFEDITSDFKSLGTQHSKKFIIVLEKHVEGIEPTENSQYLINYFKACVKKHGNNLGCNQATKMLASAYNKIFNMTV